MGNVQRIVLSRRFLNQDITAEATVYPRGIHVSVFGGEQPRIGAVSIVDPEGRITTTQFTGHRDGEISQRWAEALCGGDVVPAVIDAGIHYDSLSTAGYDEIVNCSRRLLDELLEKIL